MNEIIWNPGMTLESLEKVVILKAYQFFKFNKTVTSNALGISTKTLDNKLEQYDRESGMQRERETYEHKRRQEHLARSRGIPPDNLNQIYHRQGPLPSSSPGIRMEPITNTAEKQPMPMPERKEVQKVLHPDTSKSGNKKKSG